MQSEGTQECAGRGGPRKALTMRNGGEAGLAEDENRRVTAGKCGEGVKPCGPSSSMVSLRV